MARFRGWTVRRPLTVATLIAVAILGAACGGASTALPPSNTSSTATATTTPSTTTVTPASTTIQSPDSAILTAYRAGWAAFEHAEADADPLDPRLPATMVDPLLHQVEANLVADHQEGIVGRGPITLHPRVASVTSTTAVVLDCSYSASFLVYKKTGKQVPPVTSAEDVGVKATLVLDGSTWKVKSQHLIEGRCPAGY